MNNEGNWIDENCPKCGASLLSDGSDKWCSFVECDWWLEEKNDEDTMWEELEGYVI